MITLFLVVIVHQILESQWNRGAIELYLTDILFLSKEELQERKGQAL